MRDLSGALEVVHGNATFEEALFALALKARLLIPSHQSAVSYIPDGDFRAGIHTCSFSEKYEKYNSYDVQPTGDGIWSCLVHSRKPVRMTQVELEAHPRWRNFSDLKDPRGLEHPPMRGWLASPVLRPDGSTIGAVQLSDRREGDYTEADQELLELFANVCAQTFELHYLNQELSRQRAQLEREVSERTAELRRELDHRIEAEEERIRLNAKILETQKLESLGVLAGGIAHDFNNILAAMMGFADLALAKLPPEEPAHALVQEVRSAADRAAGLSEQMLAYSGRGKFVTETVSVNQIVEEMSQLLSASVSKKAVIEYDLNRDLPAVDVDVTQVRQVLMNLVSNASDAIADRGGTISVSTGLLHCPDDYLAPSPFLPEEHPTGQYVYLDVTDTGCGMGDEVRGRIFDPFFSTKFTGRGLGLAAVLGIVRGHRGAIRVDSRPGCGTSVRVLFPPSNHRTAQQPAAPRAIPSPPATGSVLVVDDEETVLAVSRLALEGAGFTVLGASDGSEALAVFRQKKDEIACVLLDLTMPRMDGVEVFREISRIRADVPVVLSSGYNEQEIAQRFGEDGPVGFLKKPIGIDSLVQAVREAIAERSALHQPTHQLDDARSKHTIG